MKRGKMMNKYLYVLFSKSKLIKHLIILLFIVIGFVTCNKKNDSGCVPVSASSEYDAMAAFCNANGINYTVDSNGIYYQVIDQGSGVKPNANSIITVTYTASTLDGNVVEDKTEPVTMPLIKFNEGWQLAMPYIQKGGHIKMIIPSSLAYGCTGVANLIAPNSPLYYDVVLINVE